MSTRPLIETGFNFRPGALIPGVNLEIGEPSIKKGTLLGSDRNVLVRQRIPQRLNQLQPINRAKPQGLRQQVRVHAPSIPQPIRLVPFQLFITNSRKPHNEPFP